MAHGYHIASDISIPVPAWGRLANALMFRAFDRPDREGYDEIDERAVRFTDDRRRCRAIGSATRSGLVCDLGVAVNPTQDFSD